MRIITTLFFSMIFILSNSQNNVFENKEIGNFGILNLGTATTWSTTKSSNPGKFSNYGSASFKDGSSELHINSTPISWINGYVKHYATSGNTTHVYPVGSTNLRMFLSTSGEIIGGNISVAWIEGNPSSVTDLTGPNSGVHPTSSSNQSNSEIKSVSSIGQWDWIGNYTGEVTVNIKLPSSFTGSNLRLVGWNGSIWTNLGTQGPIKGVLTGTVPASITALGIGSTTVVSNFKINETINNNEIINNSFKIYPNPTNNGFVNLEFKLNSYDKAKIVVSDINGKEVFNKLINVLEETNKESINLSNLSNGIYTISLLSEDNFVIETQKLILKQ